MVLEKAKEMLAEKLGCSPEDITAETKFEELGLDSLDMAEMLMNLEDEFGVTVEIDESLTTVGALVERLEPLLNA